jgi:hypothetical protein
MKKSVKVDFAECDKCNFHYTDNRRDMLAWKACEHEVKFPGHCCRLDSVIEEAP